MPDKLALDTTEAECKTMQQTKRCGDQLMTLKDDKWSYNVEPKEQSQWMWTTLVFTTNCMLEEITLTQINEFDPIKTPLGVANVTDGTHSHNHLTLIWDATYTTKIDNSPRQLEAGTGLFYNSSTPGIVRLDDEKKQLGFHMRYEPRCQYHTAIHSKCTDPKFDAFSVIGESHLFVILYPINGSTTVPRPDYVVIKSLIKTENDSADVINARLNGRIQYLEDVMTSQENEIIRIVNSMQCELRRAAHARAVSTAQYNGWLAASQLKLPKCTKLVATGQTITAIKCKLFIAEFTTEVTSCGPQPRYQSYTINKDGWELVTFGKCYWSIGFVNFNDKPHAYRNNTWQPIEANIVLPQQDLANTFRYADVNPLDYEHRSNPAYTDSMLNPMNVLADFSATMNEHSAGYFGFNDSTKTITVLHAVAEKVAAEHINTWWENLKLYTFITIISIIALVIARFLYAFGVCGMLWTICCKIPHARTTSPNSQQQRIELRELIRSNPTISI